MEKSDSLAAFQECTTQSAHLVLQGGPAAKEYRVTCRGTLQFARGHIKEEKWSRQR